MDEALEQALTRVASAFNRLEQVQKTWRQPNNVERHPMHRRMFETETASYNLKRDSGRPDKHTRGDTRVDVWFVERTYKPVTEEL